MRHRRGAVRRLRHRRRVVAQARPRFARRWTLRARNGRTARDAPRRSRRWSRPPARRDRPVATGPPESLAAHQRLVSSPSVAAAGGLSGLGGRRRGVSAKGQIRGVRVGDFTGRVRHGNDHRRGGIAGLVHADDLAAGCRLGDEPHLRGRVAGFVENGRGILARRSASFRQIQTRDPDFLRVTSEVVAVEPHRAARQPGVSQPVNGVRPGFPGDLLARKPCGTWRARPWCRPPPPVPRRSRAVGSTPPRIDQ